MSGAVSSIAKNERDLVERGIAGEIGSGRKYDLAAAEGRIPLSDQPRSEERRLMTRQSIAFSIVLKSTNSAWLSASGKYTEALARGDMGIATYGGTRSTIPVTAQRRERVVSKYEFPSQV
jgi:hypothetical protein